MKKIRRIAVAIGLLAGSVAISEGAASAQVNHCSTSIAFKTVGYSSCSGGWGSQRAVALCTGAVGGNGNYYNYGAWVPVGSVSSAQCAKGVIWVITDPLL